MSRLATQPARASGEFAIGGALPVVRLGFGTMQIPGSGVWGEPRDHAEPCSRRGSPRMALFAGLGGGGQPSTLHSGLDRPGKVI